MKFIKLKLFSHIKVKGEAPYESVISRFENASVSDSRLPLCKQEASWRAATRKGAQALCWDSCDDERFLTEREKKKYKAEIYNNACEALLPVVIPQSFERCIYSAVPSVEEKDGRTMLVLNCECYRTLSEAELDEICEWWENKIVEAHEHLNRKQIKIRKHGNISIYLWYKGWAVEPVFPAGERSRYENTKQK
jgi:hypothetical protein